MLKKYIFVLFLIVTIKEGFASTRQDFEKDLVENSFMMIDAVLYSAFNQPNSDLKSCAELLEKTIFSQEFFQNVKNIEILEVGGKDFYVAVASAALLAFADKNYDYWQNYKTLQLKDTPEGKLLFKFCAMIKLFQINLQHSKPLGSSSPFTLSETFNNIINYNYFQNQFFLNAPSVDNKKCIEWIDILQYQLNFGKKELGIFLSRNYQLHTLDNTNFLASFSDEFKEYMKHESEIAKYLKSNPQLMPSVDIANLQKISNPLLNVNNIIQNKNVQNPKIVQKNPVKPEGITLKADYLNILNEPETTERVADSKLNKDFTIPKYGTYKISPPPLLSTHALNVYKYSLLVMEKFKEIYPEFNNATTIGDKVKSATSLNGKTFKELFDIMVKALDVYFSCTRFHDAIVNAVNSRIDYATAGRPELYEKSLVDPKAKLPFDPSNKNSDGHDNLVAIGFPFNHGAYDYVHMFRLEYEISWINPEKDLAYFGYIFNITQPVRPNCHVEQALQEIRYKTPKPRDLAQTIINNYMILGKKFIESCDYLLKFEAKHKDKAQKKWKTFFELAFNGACADEYIKALVEWDVEHGSLSDDNAADPKILGDFIDDYIKTNDLAGKINNYLTKRGINNSNYQKTVEKPSENLKDLFENFINKDLNDFRKLISKNAGSADDRTILYALLVDYLK